MIRHKLQLYFFLIVLIGVLALTFLVLRPFLPTLVLAVTAAVVFKPLHRILGRMVKTHESIAALITVFLVMIAILLPLTFFGTQVSQEIVNLYWNTYTHTGSGGLQIAQHFIDRVYAVIPLESIKNAPADFDNILRGGLDWLLQNFADIFSSLTGFLLDIVLFLLAFFYLLRDGSKLKQTWIQLSPLNDADDEAILQKLALSINSVMKGILVVALVHGMLVGLGFAYFGVPNPILWGGVTILAALIPVIGTALVVAPAIAYLLIIGQTISALGLFLWGICAIALMDNFLGPRLMSRRAHIHSFLMLLAILGGIALFGPLGFIFGPLVLSLLSALLDMYSSIAKDALAA